MNKLLTDKEFLESGYHVDALLCSHERCGRMWTSSVLTEYMISIFGTPTITDLGLEDNGDKSRLLRAWIQSQQASEIEHPLVLPTHHVMNKTFAQLAQDRKIILLVRDLRDMMVSWYYKKTAWEESINCSFSEFIQHPKFGLSKVCNYYNLMSQHLKENSHIVVKYEDLKKDSLNQFTQVLSFLDLTTNLEALELSLEESTLEKGRNTFLKSRAKEGGSLKPEQTPFRKGQVGDYMNEFTLPSLAWFYQFLDENCIKDCKDFLYQYSLV